MKSKKEYSRNETIALMHKDTAFALNALADHIEKWKMPRKEIVKYLREIADSKEAQAFVVELREELNIKPTKYE